MTFGDFDGLIANEFPWTSEAQRAQFRAMEGLYAEWNSKINVISRKDIANLYEHHVLHSLAIAKYLILSRFSGEAAEKASRQGGGDGIRGGEPERMDDVRQGGGPEIHEADSAKVAAMDKAVQQGSPAPAGFWKGETVLDLGTGGGFPGIPLAVLYPETHFTLCDSIGKKTVVAKAVADALSLGNVETVNARAESLGTRFDWVVSRAVASLCDFYPWVRGKYRRGILCLKGGDVATETADLMRRCRLGKGRVKTWEIASWLHGEWFAGKFVVEIQ